MTAPTDLRDAVIDALSRVMDPCSVNVGAPISILDMGLVTDLHVGDDGSVTLTLRTTTPMCTLIGSMLDGADRAVSAVSAVSSVSVVADHRIGWTERSMTPAGRAFLAERRSASRAAVPVAPRAWLQ